MGDAKTTKSRVIIKNIQQVCAGVDLLVAATIAADFAAGDVDDYLNAVVAVVKVAALVDAAAVDEAFSCD